MFLEKRPTWFEIVDGPNDRKHLFCTASVALPHIIIFLTIIYTLYNVPYYVSYAAYV